MTKDRIDIDSMFFGMLDFVAQRSTCTRADVGAMIVRDRRPISMGYNGAPPGMPHCHGVGCEEEAVGVDAEAPQEAKEFARFVIKEGCQRTVHAEANSIAFAARNGIATGGTTMYCTHAPCYTCAKLMLSAGIAEFKYKKEYRDRRGLDLITSAGLHVVKYV